MTYLFCKITAKESHFALLHYHYAKRLPPISFAYGAFKDNALVGVVTFGKPVSSTLRTGVCGPAYANNVLELNRLWCISEKNLASQLVSKALKWLPDSAIVVSYADTQQGHVGYVYQATNFIYTGLSAKRTDWSIKGLEHLHSATISDLSRGQANRAEWMRKTYGDRFYLRPRPRKHRYVYARGAMRKLLLAHLNYGIEGFPKGESRRYEIDYGATK